MPMLLVWLQFAPCVEVIGVAGGRLSRCDDGIASLTGLPPTESA
jgi:cation:H+ antiporter